MPTKEEIFESWAPTGDRWSNWAKPVLFAHLDEPLADSVPLDVPPAPEWIATSGNQAVVIDLPGNESVILALAIAGKGFRPVPLFNAVPFPLISSDAGVLPLSTVDVRPTMHALYQGTFTLRQLAPSLDAPPVFMLDANRRGSNIAASPGSFDNRSVSFITDFPSAIFLQTHGIQEILLVQSSGEQPQSDLAHTLRRWQDDGLIIRLKRLDQTGPAVAMEVARPSRFGAIWHRALAALGLRRNVLGGFGGLVPIPGNG